MFVKGTAVRTTLAAIEEVYGAAGLDKVRAALPPEIATELSGLVLATKSYPISVAAAIQEAVRTELGQGTLQANRKVGAAAGRIDFGGVYRVFLRASSYEMLLGSLDRAFRQYNSQGRVSWERIEKGEADGSIREVTGYTEAMWAAIAGRLEALLLLSGAKSATATIHSTSPEHVELRLRWKT